MLDGNNGNNDNGDNDMPFDKKLSSVLTTKFKDFTVTEKASF